MPYTTDIAYVDGITTLASGALVYVTSAGVVRVAEGKATWLLSKPMNLVPANGASGRGAYGESWLYLSNLIGGEIHRLYVGEAGAPLPVR